MVFLELQHGSHGDRASGTTMAGIVDCFRAVARGPASGLGVLRQWSPARGRGLRVRGANAQAA